MTAAPAAALAADAVVALRTTYPALYRLYQAYPAYHKGLSDYANRQGFRRPVEHLATVVHELVHVDSYTHQGFAVDGTYYEPYLRRDAWPRLTNEQVAPHLVSQERGIIYQLYVRNAPANHLGNVLDEINAYGHVMPFVCRHEPESAEKQTRNMTGLLHLLEGYLRVLRIAHPAEYVRLGSTRESRGALALIAQRARDALRACGVSDQAIPAQETAYLIDYTGGSR